MSIYSGFSTRNQEAQYNRLLENLINLLQTRVLQQLKSSPMPSDQLWYQKFSSIYSNMKNLEMHKYLEPKLTESCKGLASYFSLDFPVDHIYSEYEYQLPSRARLNESKKTFSTPRKKNFSFKSRNEKSQKPAVNSGYYGKLMNNFLSDPKTTVAKKKNSSISIETQDFWLLDDNIRLIEHDNY